MTDVVLVAVITVVGGIVTTFITKKLNAVDARVTQVGKDIDGRVTQLLEAKDAVIETKDKVIEVKGDLDHAQGKQEGIAEKQVEVDKLNKETKPDIPKRE